MEEIDRIKKIIEKAGLTRDEAARRLGVSSKTLGSWLNSKSFPRKKNIESIRRVYRELFGRKNGKDSDVAVRKKLSDILLTTKKEAITRDLDDDESDARKIYYDGKVIAWTLEKQNRDKLIMFPLICKNEGEWYKMGGNSALFYTYYVAPRLKRKPIIRKDSDIKYRFSKGLVMVHWIDRFIECVEGLGQLCRKGICTQDGYAGMLYVSTEERAIWRAIWGLDL